MNIAVLVIFSFVFAGLVKKLGSAFKENVVIRQQLGDERVEWILKQEVKK